MKLNHSIAALTILFCGCAIDGGDASVDSPTVEVTSAISVAGGATWFGTSPTSLGPIDQQTCWLTGIGGAFTGQPYEANTPSGGTLQSNKARVRVYPNKSTGLWMVDTDKGLGGGTGVRVMCVNIPWTSNKVHEFSWSDNLASVGYTGNLGTRCFLRDVWATSGLNSQLTTIEPNITLSRRVNGSQAIWDFGNSYVRNYGGDQEFGGGTAVCVDTTLSGHWDYTFVGATSDVLRDYYPSGPRVPIASIACGLTGIRGDWHSGANTYGAWLNNDPASTQYWKIDVNASRTVNVSCLK